MSESLIFGVVASSALVLGALAGGRLRIPKRVLASMLAFAAGALITALAFDLFLDSYEQGGLWRSVLGLSVGAVVFTVVSQRLDRMAEGHHEEDHGSEKLDTDAPASDAATSLASVSGAAGLALLAAVTLDGVPENLALGVSLRGQWRAGTVGGHLRLELSRGAGGQRLHARTGSLACVHPGHLDRLCRCS